MFFKSPRVRSVKGYAKTAVRVASVREVDGKPRAVSVLGPKNSRQRTPEEIVRYKAAKDATRRAGA